MEEKYKKTSQYTKEQESIANYQKKKKNYFLI